MKAADRTREPTAHANTHPATDAPPAVRSRPGAAKSGFRVETWKTSAGGFRPYQTYDDENAALHVKRQLEWVGARVRIVRA